MIEVTPEVIGAVVTLTFMYAIPELSNMVMTAFGELETDGVDESVQEMVSLLVIVKLAHSDSPAKTRASPLMFETVISIAAPETRPAGKVKAVTVAVVSGD